MRLNCQIFEPCDNLAKLYISSILIVMTRKHGSICSCLTTEKSEIANVFAQQMQ